MFRIVCMVEDKKLGLALHALAGLVVNMEPPVPVANATVKGGVVKQVSVGTSFKARFIEGLAAAKGGTVDMATLKARFKALGGNPNTVNGTLMNELIDAKILRRRSRGVYFVL